MWHENDVEKRKELEVEFEVYVKNVEKEDLKIINQIINGELDSDPHKLKAQEDTIIRWLDRAQEISMKLGSFYDKAKELYYPPKDFGTADEKSTKLNSDICHFKEIKSILENKVCSLRNKMFSAKSELSKYKP